MIPIQPYKAVDFHDLLKPKIPDPISPVAAAIPASPSPGDDDNFNWVLFLCMGALALVVVVGINHLANKQAMLQLQLTQISAEVKKGSHQDRMDQRTDDLLTDTKTTNHETAID
jgi:hypothetical protein